MHTHEHLATHLYIRAVCNIRNARPSASRKTPSNVTGVLARVIFEHRSMLTGQRDVSLYVKSVQGGLTNIHVTLAWIGCASPRLRYSTQELTDTVSDNTQHYLVRVIYSFNIKVHLRITCEHVFRNGVFCLNAPLR